MQIQSKMQIFSKQVLVNKNKPNNVYECKKLKNFAFNDQRSKWKKKINKKFQGVQQQIRKVLMKKYKVHEKTVHKKMKENQNESNYYRQPSENISSKIMYLSGKYEILRKEAKNIKQMQNQLKINQEANQSANQKINLCIVEFQNNLAYICKEAILNK